MTVVFSDYLHVSVLFPIQLLWLYKCNSLKRSILLHVIYRIKRPVSFISLRLYPLKISKLVIFFLFITESIT